MSAGHGPARAGRTTLSSGCSRRRRTDGCIVVVEERSEAELRFANNTVDDQRDAARPERDRDRRA